VKKSKRRRKQKELTKSLENPANGLPIDTPPAHQTLTISQALDLAIQHQGAGNLSEAEGICRKVLQISPDQHVALHLLGVIAHQVGRNEIAVELISKALQAQPDNAEMLNSLGGALHGLGHIDEAIKKFKATIELNPNYVLSYFNLGNVLSELWRMDEAVSCYRNVLEIKRDYAEVHFSLGLALQNMGNVDGATKQIDMALSYKPENIGWRIRKALLFPVIPDSIEDIISRRKDLDQAIQVLQEQNLKIRDPVVEVGVSNFYLIYHDYNNRQAVSEIAKLYISICPDLTYVAKHCQHAHKSDGHRLRIGFLSAYFHNHTIGKLMRGIIEHFSRDHFEVVVFRLPGKKDHMSDAIENASDRFVPLVKSLHMDRKIIEDQKLDILLYPDIGMDPYTYFLSFSRLAPVQAVSWGHGDTTGVPNIDYFLSSDLLESADAADHYTETLVRLPHLPTYYVRPEFPKSNHNRSDFGLPENGRLYTCPQTLYKFHPVFDRVIGELLRRDPDGWLVLIDDWAGGCWKKRLRDRFLRIFPDVADRVVFVPQMPQEMYLSLLTIADAIIDIPTFSGGISAIEAFSVGAPIATWENKFMRSRVTAAYYRQMGLSELVATDEQAYLKLVLKLAQDTDFKTRMQADINANAGKLFETLDPVREMETFFIAAYDAWKTGKALAGYPFDNVQED
jgi:protein O-GlcNAc transferase